MPKVIFLDKDGTIIPDIPYNIDPLLITLNPGVGEGLKILKELGYEFVVISNQAGVALGKFKENELDSVFTKINYLLEPYKINIKAFYYCPHHPNGIINNYAINCDCRKPLPGLIKKAADDFEIDLNRSWMIGDILNDIEAGRRAGCRNILIDNGNETEWIINEDREPDYIAKDFLEAAKFIE